MASPNAKFGQPEVKLGIVPGYGGTQRLPRLVGRGRAIEMLLSGETIDAAEAYRIGLVNYIVPPRNCWFQPRVAAQDHGERTESRGACHGSRRCGA